jgi:hypothetical protein
MLTFSQVDKQRSRRARQTAASPLNVKPFDFTYVKEIMVGRFWLRNSQVVPASENTV